MHKTYKLIIQVIILSHLAFIAFFSSCYEPIEACLDVNARNYDVSADRACDSCCTYPSLSLSIQHTFNGDLVSAGDTLVNKDSTTIMLNDFRYFISDVMLSNETMIYNVVDSVASNCGVTDGTISYIPNDQIYVVGNNSSYTVGFWRVNDMYQKISLKLGLSDCVHDAGISSIDSKSNLEPLDSLYAEGLGYTFAQLQLNDSLFISFQGKSETVQLERDIDIIHERGANVVIPLKVNFSIWFQDIDFENDDIAVIKSKLQMRIQDAILIEE